MDGNIKISSKGVLSRIFLLATLLSHTPQETQSFLLPVILYACKASSKTVSSISSWIFLAIFAEFQYGIFSLSKKSSEIDN